MRYSFDHAKDLVLVAAYETLVFHAEWETFGADKIHEIIHPHLGLGYVRRLLSILASEKLIVVDQYDEHSLPHYTVSDEGIRLAENIGPLQALIDEGRSVSGAIPASDRLVTIGDNNPGYDETVSSLEDASNQIRGSNGIDPDEKSWISENLTRGIEIFKRGGRVLMSGLRAFLLEPLNAALKASSEQNLNSAIKIAIAALRTHFGL